MNPELYERYLAKKAKKLGITVEELKAQGTSSPVSESSVTSSNTEQTISQESGTGRTSICSTHDSRSIGIARKYNSSTAAIYGNAAGNCKNRSSFLCFWTFKNSGSSKI